MSSYSEKTRSRIAAAVIFAMFLVILSWMLLYFSGAVPHAHL